MFRDVSWPFAENVQTELKFQALEMIVLSGVNEEYQFKKITPLITFFSRGRESLLC